MKRPQLARVALALAILTCLGGPAAAALTGRILQVVTAPGGGTSYYLLQDGPGSAGHAPPMTIASASDGERVDRILLRSKSSMKPAENLTELSNLELSPDSKTLFFEAQAWATEDAIHALDLNTGAERFVVAGELRCVLPTGEYEGDLIVEQHHYFVQGGSFDDLYLFDARGKKLGIVEQGTNTTGICPGRSL